VRIGELFAGYGGLGMGVQAAIAGEVVWVSEIDEAACRVLDARLGVPNLGDITAVDWTDVELVDVLTGGFPCQDVSLAGNRAGLAHGTRSGLWTHFAHAIDVLRPGLVAIENVRGLLSAPAAGDVEPCPWCLGDAGDEHHLRALGAVLGDLADLGYDAQWITVPASAVDAAHKRERVFILAWPADTDRQGSQGPVHALGEPAERGGATRHTPDGLWERRRGHVEPEGEHEARGTGRATQDADDEPRGQRRQSAPGQAEGGRPRADAPPAADADRDGHESLGRLDPIGRDPHGRRGEDRAWGAYEPAVRRWERAIGRPAPRPVEPSTKGTPVLSARFVEWLMGLPEGWVTDLCTRREALKMLGNGVVPQQAAYAVRVLLGLTAGAVSAPAELLPTPEASDGSRGPSLAIGGTRDSGAKRAVTLTTIASRNLRGVQVDELDGPEGAAALLRDGVHVGRPVAGDGDPRADRLGEGGAHLVGCGVAVEGGHDGVGSHDLKHAQPAPQRNSRPETDQIVGAA
jgi:DNA (cytosine-5)-methyltransferase 1